MAHRCWAVDEIVRAIVAYLVWNQKRASAVALACCSKSLEEPALGEVWRKLSSLVPLVKCFPPEIWDKDSGYLAIFKRAPTQQEWIRFQKRYASKVRYLSENSYGFDLSSTALHMLQLYSSGRPLLPNLISLKWFSDETGFPFLSLFISSSLESIAIRAPTKASAVLPPILQKLSKLSSNIRDIEIEIYGGGNQLYHVSMEASSQLLIHFNRLRKFNFGSPISASALRHLIQLPSLEELSLIVDSFQLPGPLPTLVFPSLRKLYVECNGDPTWLKLLPSIENPVLTSILVKCPGSGIERFMETFQQTMGGCGMQESFRELVENTLISPHR